MSNKAKPIVYGNKTYIPGVGKSRSVVADKTA